MSKALRRAVLGLVLALPGCGRTGAGPGPEPAVAARPPDPPPGVPEPPPVEAPRLPRSEPPPALDFDRLPDRPWLPKDPLPVPPVRPEEKRSAAEKTLRRAISFCGLVGTKAEYPRFGKVIGWGGSYSGDLKHRTGEGVQPLPPDVVLVTRCSAPIGTALLSAYRATGDPEPLELARQAGNLLLAGQSPWGGWHAEMWVGPKRARGIHVYPGFDQWPDAKEERGSDNATFDDSCTTPEAEYLYRLWWVTKERRYYEGWRRTMDFIVLAQKERGNGGYPQGFPQGSYHAYSTFNDGVMAHCFDAMLLAWRRTGDRRYYDSAIRCADWIASVKRPGQGWGTQYDGDKIGGARKFEPPGLGPDATVDAIGILRTAFDWTGDPKYVEAIRDAASWLEKSQIGKGRWARYYHPDTNGPWYRDAEGNDVASREQAKGGYTWEGGFGSEGLKIAQALKDAGRKDPKAPPAERGDPSADAEWMEQGAGRDVQGLIDSMTDRGVWYAKRGRRPRRDGSGEEDPSRLTISMGFPRQEWAANVKALAQAILAGR